MNSIASETQILDDISVSANVLFTCPEGGLNPIEVNSTFRPTALTLDICLSSRRRRKLGGRESI